jgi:hypothetical protein
MNGSFVLERLAQAAQHIAHHLGAVLGVLQLAFDAQLLVARQLDVLVLLDQVMMFMGSIGGWGLKVMLITPGAASTFTTP